MFSKKKIFKHSSEIKTSHLYTELQHSHMENGKYKRIVLWMERKTEKPLNGLVYDYARDEELVGFKMATRMVFGTFFMKWTS